MPRSANEEAQARLTAILREMAESVRQATTRDEFYRVWLSGLVAAVGADGGAVFEVCDRNFVARELAGDDPIALKRQIDFIVHNAAQAMTNALRHEQLFLLPLWRSFGLAAVPADATCRTSRRDLMDDRIADQDENDR